MNLIDFNKQFRIRDYRDGDFEGVNRLWTETDMGNTKRGDNEKTIADTIKIGGRMLVMEELATNKISGTSWMTFDGRRILLHHFGILPEFQGRGYASILLKESLKHVKDKGYQVKLEVHRSNVKAINVYKKHGFEYLGDYDVYIIRDIAGL
jgi:ribosomal protein S18 acetylase RimI-like enzyme